MKPQTILLVALLVIGQSLNLFAQHPITPDPPDKGDGSSGNPFQIETLNHLYWIAVETRGGNDFAGEYFLQTDDIDADDTAGWFDDNEGWMPMGVWDSDPFSGNYNGDGHTISNLHIDRPEEEDVSLFGYILEPTISNLGLKNVAITGGGITGGITGYANDSEISNCSVSGSIVGEDFVGGISAWFIYGEINNSYNAASVEGKDLVGGISSLLEGVQVNNSYNMGNLSGINNIGGLVGRGFGDSEIRYSYSAGSITVIDAGEKSDPDPEKEGSNTRISRHNNLRDQFSKDEPVFGGVIGSGADITITNCFWDVDEDGIEETESGNDNFGATGKTTAEMKEFNTFSDSGWNISPDPDIPADYPFLAWEDDSSKSSVWKIGTGTDDDPVAVPVSNIALYLSLALIAGFVFFRICRVS